MNLYKKINFHNILFWFFTNQNIFNNKIESMPWIINWLLFILWLSLFLFIIISFLITILSAQPMDDQLGLIVSQGRWDCFSYQHGRGVWGLSTGPLRVPPLIVSLYEATNNWELVWCRKLLDNQCFFK